MHKCQILHLGWSKAGHTYKWGEEWLGSSPAERDLGVLAGSRLSASQQPALAAQRANPIPGFIKNSTVRRQSCPAAFGAGAASPGACPLRFWAPPLKKNMRVLECVQSRATQMVTGLEGMACEEQLRTSGLSSLEKRRLRGDLIALYSFLRRGCGEEGADLFFPSIQW